LQNAKAEYIWEHGSLQGWSHEMDRVINATPFFTNDEKASLLALTPADKAPSADRFGSTDVPQSFVTDPLMKGDANPAAVWNALDPATQEKYRNQDAQSQAPVGTDGRVAPPAPGQVPSAPVPMPPRVAPVGGGFPAANPLPDEAPTPKTRPAQHGASTPPGLRQKQSMVTPPPGMGPLYSQGDVIRGDQLGGRLNAASGGFTSLTDIVRALQQARSTPAPGLPDRGAYKRETPYSQQKGPQSFMELIQRMFGG
jgi:hypothetical protein